MYDYTNRRYSADSEWGTLFGLKSTDLTDDQLSKVNFDKLLEFMETDPRAERLMGDKLLTDALTKIEHIKSLKDEEISKRPHLLLQYNVFVKKRGDEIEKNSTSTYYANENRAKYVRWALLDNSNRFQEIQRLMDEKTSVVSLKEIDHGELYDNNAPLARKLTEHVLKTGQNAYILNLIDTIDHDYIYKKHADIGGSIITHAFSAGSNVLKNVIQKMPKEVFLAILPKMFEHNQHIYSYALCHKDTPKAYTLKALRAIAKRRNIPMVKTPINLSMLKELPPITRLDVLESIMWTINSKIDLPFEDDVTDESLKHILFTSVIRHTKRVDYVVNRLKYLRGES